MLTQWVDGVWTNLEPFEFLGAKFDRMMGVIRLDDDSLFIYGPNRLPSELKDVLAATGEVSCFMVPSLFHDNHANDWCAAYPDAKVIAPPGLALECPEERIVRNATDALPDDLIAVTVEGMPKVHETVVYDELNKTLFVADLMFNLADAPGRTRWDKRFYKLAGFGSGGELAVSRLFRFLTKDKVAFRRSCDRILEFEIERLVVGHGAVVTVDAYEKVRDALSRFK
ncbi:MAG: hypothetical protein O3A46_08170 [Candidatus Poribacteria bacterium]|nr:hypothetical protein [Candidatus Poribacteria bacterium]